MVMTRDTPSEDDAGWTWFICTVLGLLFLCWSPSSFLHVLVVDTKSDHIPANCLLFSSWTTLNFCISVAMLMDMGWASFERTRTIYGPVWQRSRFTFSSQTLLDPTVPPWIRSTKIVDLPLDPWIWCSTSRGAPPNVSLVELGEITHQFH